MMKRAFTLVEFIVVVVIILILAAILFPVFFRARCYASASNCQSNQKQIGQAFFLYAQDFDGRLPPVALRSVGWADLLQSYAKGWVLWNCPQTPANPPRTTDYFFNGRLARFPIKRVVLPEKTLLVGEGDNAGPPSAELRRFPMAALGNKKSPAWRHGEAGADYLFSDGHVEWIKPEDFDAKVKWNPRHLSP